MICSSVFHVKRFCYRQYYMCYIILWNTQQCSTSSLALYYFHYGDITLTITCPYLCAYAAYPGHLYNRFCSTISIYILKGLASVYQLIHVYTIHNKFSNCFVRVSPSTSDLKFHLLSWRYKRRTSDKNFHLKKYGITKRSGRAKVTLSFKSRGNVGISDHWGEAKNSFKQLFGHWNKKA